MVNRLTLTDDEAAFISLRASGDWRAPLPTVNPDSRPDVLRAVLRGRRSLAVRDLADGEGSPTGPAADVVQRLGVGLRAFFLLADADDRWLPEGITVYLYGSSVDAVELSHVVAAAGVHYLRVAPPAGQWGALTGLAEAIFADGFGAAAGGGARSPAAALLHVVRPDGLRFIRVARSTVTSGRGPVPARFRSVSEGVVWLLG